MAPVGAVVAAIYGTVTERSSGGVGFPKINGGRS